MNNNLVTVDMAARAEKLNNLLLAQEEGFRIEYSRVWKNNRELEGYVLRTEGSNVAPTVYREDGWYQKSDEEVIRFLKDMLQKHGVASMDVSSYLEKDYVLSHILPRLVSKSNGAELESRKIAHMPFLDMYILFYVPIEDFCDDGVGSIQVTEELLKRADISIDEAYSASLSNIEPNAEVKTMQEVLYGEMGISEFAEVPEIPMYICSVKNRIQGAAVMLSRKILDEIESRIGGRAAILPSSIHECIAVPYNSEEELSTFLSLVKEVNATQVEPIDKLTDSVYYIEDHQVKLAV